MNRVKTIVLAMLLTGLLCPQAGAGVEPVPWINFQGVLRDASDHPLTGNYDMTFRFFDAAAAGNEILVDRHLASGTGAVPVSGGQFGAVLGRGAVSDGSGPGAYTDLALVFRDYAAVYLEIQVGAEVLGPRTQVFSAPSALNASNLGGKGPSQYLDTSSTAQTKYAQLKADATGIVGSFGMWGVAPGAGGFFQDSDSSGFGYVGYGDTGAAGWGNFAGGYFKDNDESGYGYVGWGDYGVRGYGNAAGGYFKDLDSSGYAYAGYGDYGIRGYGNTAGARFDDIDGSGYGYVGYGEIGVQGSGNDKGGVFTDLDGNGTLWAGYWSRGIQALGSDMGGLIYDIDGTGTAYIGNGNIGIWATGSEAGARFQDGSTSEAYVAYGSTGIDARGSLRGGRFYDTDDSNYEYVAYSTYKIWGNGASTAFVQNHPEDPSKVVVYAAPEGDEIATYTRGSARLTNGEARVPLDETFRWVTNPDIGLTAHVTPRGDCRGLAVVSLTTSGMVVRELDGGTSDVAFDYLVYGLRIGFEESAVVHEKLEESPIPSMASHRALYAQDPSLRRYNALERFKEMRSSDGPLDLSRTAALKAAIHEFDPAVDARPEDSLSALPKDRLDPNGRLSRRENAPTPSPGTSAPDLCRAPSMSQTSQIVEPVAGATVEAKPVPTPLFSVSEQVEEGDLLVLDPLRPGELRRAVSPADPTVAGIAEARADWEGDRLVAPLVNGIYAVVKADASLGAILPGDLLVSSATPGHAMRSEAPAPGTVIGKALEPLKTGTGLIRVLLMMR